MTNETKDILNLNCNRLLEYVGRSCAVVDDVEHNGHYYHIACSRFFYRHTGTTGTADDLARFLLPAVDADRVLFEMAGVEWNDHNRSQLANWKAERDLRQTAWSKLREAHPVTAAPPNVQEFLTNHKLTEKSHSRLTYIPSAEAVRDGLTEAEVQLIDCGALSGKLVVWDHVDNRPRGYCTYGIATQEVLAGNDTMVLNQEALLTAPVVMLCEGPLNLLSLHEMDKCGCAFLPQGYADDQKRHLLFLLVWRKAMHPDWKFIVLLNDTSSSPFRCLVTWLFGQGASCHYFQPSKGRDMHAYHLSGDSRLLSGISATYNKPIDECILDTANCDMFHLVTTSMQRDPRILNHTTAFYDLAVGPMAKKWTKAIRNRRITWRGVYDDRIEFVYCNPAGIHVKFKKGIVSGNSIQTYPPAMVMRALAKYQNHPLTYEFKDLDFPYLLDTYRVGRESRPTSTEYNRYVKTCYLTASVTQGAVYPLPSNIGLLLGNLGSPEVIEYLLNMLGHYLQTFEKPQVIPYLMGGQGTGKGTFADIMGFILGDYFVKTTRDLLENFNGWKTNSAVVLLDEIKGETPAQRKKLEQVLLPLVNSRQSVRRMYAEATSTDVNNLILIANNADISENVFRVANDDRRYLVVSGGNNVKLTDTDWWNRDALMAEVGAFAMYLRTRAVDAEKAKLTPMTADKRRLIHESMPVGAQLIKERLEDMRLNTLAPQGEIALTELHAQLTGTHPAIMSRLRTQDIKGYMMQYLDIRDDAYWPKRHNKTFFNYGKYLETHPEEATQITPEAGTGTEG